MPLNSTLPEFPISDFLLNLPNVIQTAFKICFLIFSYVLSFKESGRQEAFFLLSAGVVQTVLRV